METYFELKERRLTVQMPKELDHHQAGQLRMEVDMLIDAYQVQNLTFDFAKTEFMDSSGIGVIIGRCKNIGYCGGEVSAKNLNGRLEKIFMVSGLHKLIKTETPQEKHE